MVTILSVIQIINWSFGYRKLSLDASAWRFEFYCATKWLRLTCNQASNAFLLRTNLVKRMNDKDLKGGSFLFKIRCFYKLLTLIKVKNSIYFGKYVQRSTFSVCLGVLPTVVAVAAIDGQRLRSSLDATTYFEDGIRPLFGTLFTWVGPLDQICK